MYVYHTCNVEFLKPLHSQEFFLFPSIYKLSFRFIKKKKKVYISFLFTNPV